MQLLDVWNDLHKATNLPAGGRKREGEGKYNILRDFIFRESIICYIHLQHCNCYQLLGSSVAYKTRAGGEEYTHTHAYMRVCVYVHR